MFPAIWHWLATGFSTYVLHAQHGNGYQWQSGIGSTYTPKDAVYLFALYKVARHKNCHHRGCWRIHTHIHPEHGWPSCKPHWQELPDHIALAGVPGPETSNLGE